MQYEKSKPSRKARLHNMVYYKAGNVQKEENTLRLYPAQMGTQSIGRLKARITTANMAPIENATVTIYLPFADNHILEQAKTDAAGLTDEISLPAPPPDYSQEPTNVQPYAEYRLTVSA